jgi:hypothetical protein
LKIEIYRKRYENLTTHSMGVSLFFALFEHADKEKEINEAGNEQHDHTTESGSREVIMQLSKARFVGSAISNVSEEPEVA